MGGAASTTRRNDAAAAGCRRRWWPRGNGRRLACRDGVRRWWRLECWGLGGDRRDAGSRRGRALLFGRDRRPLHWWGPGGAGGFAGRSSGRSAGRRRGTTTGRRCRRTTGRRRRTTRGGRGRTGQAHGCARGRRRTGRAGGGAGGDPVGVSRPGLRCSSRWLSGRRTDLCRGRLRNGGRWFRSQSRRCGRDGRCGRGRARCRGCLGAHWMRRLLFGLAGPGQAVTICSTTYPVGLRIDDAGGVTLHTYAKGLT